MAMMRVATESVSLPVAEDMLTLRAWERRSEALVMKCWKRWAAEEVSCAALLCRAEELADPLEEECPTLAPTLTPKRLKPKLPPTEVLEVRKADWLSPADIWLIA